MILVKSLIVIFLMLIVFKFAKPILKFLVNLFDGRESFMDENAANDENEADNENEANDENEASPFKESSYSPPSVLDRHEKVSNDSKLISELQDKMNELMQLSDKATVINNQLNL